MVEDSEETAIISSCSSSSDEASRSEDEGSNWEERKTPSKQSGSSEKESSSSSEDEEEETTAAEQAVDNEEEETLVVKRAAVSQESDEDKYWMHAVKVLIIPRRYERESCVSCPEGASFCTVAQRRKVFNVVEVAVVEKKNLSDESCVTLDVLPEVQVTIGAAQEWIEVAARELFVDKTSKDTNRDYFLVHYYNDHRKLRARVLYRCSNRNKGYYDQVSELSKVPEE